MHAPRAPLRPWTKATKQAHLVHHVAAIEHGAQQVAQVGPGDVLLAVHHRRHNVAAGQQIAVVESAQGVDGHKVNGFKLLLNCAGVTVQLICRQLPPSSTHTGEVARADT